MTNQTKSQKILNGCLNWVKRTKEGINLYCGDTYQTLRKKEDIRCPTCQATLTTLKKCQKIIEERDKSELEFLNKVFDDLGHDPK